nr:phosphorylase [Sphingomonas sp. GC_Shp_1]
MQREARLIARAGWVAVAGGGDAARLEQALTAAIRSSSQQRSGSRAASRALAGEDPSDRRDDGVEMVLSIGLAGALSPELTVGDVVIASLAADEGRGPFVERLHALLPTARVGTIVGQNVPAATLADKQQLYAATGALAVDMESHVAARVAAAHGLPFAAIRAISDDAGRTLPPAALVGMKPDGGMALGAVLASLARAPAQLPALIRTGIDAERAFGALRGALDALEAGGIGRLDLGELGLDV